MNSVESSDRLERCMEWTTGVEYWNGAVESSGSLFLYHGTNSITRALKCKPSAQEPCNTLN